MQASQAEGTLVMDEFALRQFRSAAFKETYSRVLGLAAACSRHLPDAAGCPRASRDATMALCAAILAAGATALVLREAADGRLPLSAAAAELSWNGRASVLPDPGEGPDGLPPALRGLFAEYALLRREILRFVRMANLPIPEEGAERPLAC